MDFNRWLQSRLTAHGYSPGPVDGVIGPNTTRALRAFQRSRGIAPSGTADKRTVRELRLTSSQVGVRRPKSRPVPDGAPLRPLSTTEAMRRFGEVGGRQTHIPTPWPMFLAWDTSVRLSRITLHEDVADSAQAAFGEIAEEYSPEQIEDLGLHLFGGSLNVRRMRGGSSWSKHSWGIAIDFDPIRNQLRTKAPEARLSHADARAFFEAWERHGWLSLGRLRDYDWMHVEKAA